MRKFRNLRMVGGVECSLAGASSNDPSSILRKSRELALAGVAATVDLLVWAGDSQLRHGPLLPFWVIPVVTGVVYSTLLLRWRYPRCVFAVHCAYGLAGVLLPLYAPFVGLLVALYALVRTSRNLMAGAVLVACMAPFTVHSYNRATTATEGPPVLNFVVAMVLWIALGALVWAWARLARAAEQRSEREKRAQAALAVRAERLHLARELHDVVSHAVSAVILQSAGAKAFVGHDDQQVRTALEAIETTGTQAMGELHRLLGLLRAAAPEEERDAPGPRPSLRDVNTLADTARSSGADVKVRVDGNVTSLEREVDLAAYRVIQESLTNTIKHAGQGASAEISVNWSAQGLNLTIQDKAGHISSNTPKLSSGYGLIGLAERVHRVGGTLDANPTTGGFLVQAYLPTRLNQRKDSHEYSYPSR